MADEIELTIRVSDRAGIAFSRFSYDGKAVKVTSGKGVFSVQPGDKKKLRWAMVGEPGGSMKVVVFRDTAIVATRKKSTIVPPFGEAVDALDIEVS